MKTKYEIVCELAKQGKSCKEIAEITGIGLNTVYQYKTTLNRTMRTTKEKFIPGHNANRKKCASCIYRSRDKNVNGCDYAFLVKHSRGCSVEDCDKYIKGRRSDGHMRTLFR